MKLTLFRAVQRSEVPSIMVVPARIPYEKTLTKLTVLQSMVGILCLQKEWVKKSFRFFAQKVYFKSHPRTMWIFLYPGTLFIRYLCEQRSWR